MSEVLFCLILTKEVFAAIIGSLIVVGAGWWAGRKALADQYKVSVAKELYSARYQLTNAHAEKKKVYTYSVGEITHSRVEVNDNDKTEWARALNSVQVVFYKDKKVREALRRLHKGLGNHEELVRDLLVEVGIAANLLDKSCREYGYDPIQLFA